jgi:hypothetical protein
MNSFKGPAQRWTCGFSSGLEHFNSISDVQSGKVKIFNYDRTQLDLSNIPWTGKGAGTVDHPSWLMWLHSLKWIDILIEDALSATNSEKSLPSLEVASQVARSWVEWNVSSSAEPLPAWEGHAAGLRATTLVALSELVHEEWLAAAIEEHTTHLASEENFDGHWNHGLVQTMALVAGALRLDDEKTVEIARVRMLNTLREMIDPQGAINEQATAYARYIEILLRTVISIFKDNSFDDVKELKSMLSGIRLFMTHSLEPSGQFVQLGDSYPDGPDAFMDTELELAVTHGRNGHEPRDRVKVYDRGYVFGRSGWGESRPYSQESFYSLRFGPGRIIHGHNDHMSITWYDKCRHFIVDSGHSGYAPGPMRNYLRSPAAHNILEIVGQRHDWSAETILTHQSVGESASFFSLSDDAFGGIPRSRSILAIDSGPVVVLDRASSPGASRHFRQLWHVAPEFTFASSNESSVWFSSALGDLDFVIVRFNVTHDDPGSHSGLSYWKGSRDPYQGLISRRDGEELPAPCIGFDVKSEEIFLATALVAVPRGQKLGYSFRPGPRGTYIFRIHIGEVSYSVNVIKASGEMSLRL